MKPKQASKFSRIMDTVTRCADCQKPIRVGRTGIVTPHDTVVCDKCAGVIRDRSGQIISDGVWQ